VTVSIFRGQKIVVGHSPRGVPDRDLPSLSRQRLESFANQFANLCAEKRKARFTISH
jgi:hypothetical protein